jgi:N-methylhydantoinase B
VDLIALALSRAIPDKVPASSGSDLPGVLLWYFDRERGTGEAVGQGGVIGQGASSHADGESALIHHVEAGCCNIPVEVMENRAPLLVEYLELLQDSGGPGEFRGGLGVRTKYRTLAETIAIFIMERTTTPPPPGLRGGLAGRGGMGIFYPGTDHEVRGGKMKRSLHPGEAAAQETPGGAGFGRAMDRAPSAVLDDVRNGYVSLDAARDVYGVVVDPTAWTVNQRETAQLRFRPPSERPNSVGEKNDERNKTVKGPGK